MVNGRQLYKCHACGKQFLGGERLDPDALFTAYLEGKQTYGQLAERYGCSIKTIQRCLDRAKPTRLEQFSSVANVVMDTTYFGRRFGVMVFKNSLDGAILLKKYVKNETVHDEHARRPIYSLAGCSPAEPASASIGVANINQRRIGMTSAPKKQPNFCPLESNVSKTA